MKNTYLSTLIMMLISTLTFAQPNVTYNLNSNEVTVDISSYTVSNFPGYTAINVQKLGIIFQWYNHTDSTEMIIEDIPDPIPYTYNISDYTNYDFDTLTIITYMNYKLYDNNYGIFNYNEYDTTYITVNNIYEYNHETINLTQTIQIDSTIYDTTYTDVYDTITNTIPITIYDTTYITVVDTIYEFESITQTDTIYLTETVTSLSYSMDVDYSIVEQSVIFNEVQDEILIYNINGQLLETQKNVNSINFSSYPPEAYILFIPEKNPVKIIIKP